MAMNMVKNTINEYVTTYTKALDDFLTDELKTSVLDTANSQVVALNSGGEVKVPKIEVTGLRNYKRDVGFEEDAVTISYETLKLTYDRQKAFSVDAVDDMDTAFLLSADGMNHFIKKHVAPEIDAVRFMQYAKGAGNKAQGELHDMAAARKAIAAAEVALGEAGAHESMLFVSYGLYAALTAERPLTQQGDIDSRFEVYNGHRVIPMAKKCFTANPHIDENGGFTPGAEEINFMLIAPEAVRQLKKHEAIRVFAPNVNQNADAWKFQYRVHHDAFVLKDLAGGVFVHSKAGV